MTTRLCLRREKINVTLSSYAEFGEFEKTVLETERTLGDSDLVVGDLPLRSPAASTRSRRCVATRTARD
ncbi:hypothetical protein GGD81_001132 [Rhodobium orientis]|nr:hypothetical protein [Rhodobium orientis]MBB4302108.1 hypothetical protein [Rhodobium orientis]